MLVVPTDRCCSALMHKPETCLRTVRRRRVYRLMPIRLSIWCDPTQGPSYTPYIQVLCCLVLLSVDVECCHRLELEQVGGWNNQDLRLPCPVCAPSHLSSPLSSQIIVWQVIVTHEVTCHTLTDSRFHNACVHQLCIAMTQHAASNSISNPRAYEPSHTCKPRRLPAALAAI